MKKLLFISLLITNVVLAQDVIQQKSGESVKAKVKEISKTEVKYLKFDNLEGPIYILPLSDIDFIKYENGKIENYTQVEPQREAVKVTDEVFYVKDASPKIIEKTDGKESYVQGQEDAATYYRRHKAAAGWTCATTILFSPLIGFIPAVATSLTPPKIYNLNAPNVEKLKIPEYSRGYNDFAKKRKRQRVWLNFGIGTAIWGILTVVSQAGQ